MTVRVSERRIVGAEEMAGKGPTTIAEIWARIPVLIRREHG